MKRTYKKLARLLMTTMMTGGLMLAGQTGMAGTTSGTKTFDKGENLQVTSDVKAAVDLYGLSDLTQVGSDYSEEVQAKHRSAGATEALWVKARLSSAAVTAASSPTRRQPRQPTPSTTSARRAPRCS